MEYAESAHFSTACIISEFKHTPETAREIILPKMKENNFSCVCVLVRSFLVSVFENDTKPSIKC